MGGYLLKRGKRIEEMENSTGRAAWGVVLGESAEELNQRLEEFYDSLRVIDIGGRSMVRDLGEFARHSSFQNR